LDCGVGNTLRGRKQLLRQIVARVLVILSACLLLAPQPASTASQADPVIAAAGDIACGSQTPPGAACHHRQTSDLLVAEGFDAVLPLGDTQYERGALPDYQNYYHPTWGRVKSITHPVPGNHEYATAGASGYFDYFGAAAGDRTKGYYSFDLGSWHIVALNSNCANVPCHRGSPQELWLRADLAMHQNACTLAYWHHPRFTSGSVHHSDAGMQPFWQALHEFHADVVLSGHQHNYERFDPQTPTGSADPSNGIRQFIVGTGGKDLYPFGSTPAPNSAVRRSDTFGVLKLTLRPTSYDWQFLPEEGKAFTDTGTGTCVGLPGTPGAELESKTVILKAKPRKVAAGRKTNLAATVLPCEGNEGDPIRFQRRRDQTWRTVATEASDQTCTATIKRKVIRTTRFRAMSPADEDSGAGTSNPVKVRVRKERDLG
jgi:hypothetical protein